MKRGQSPDKYLYSLQRFTHALSQCMRHLVEPIVAADRLQEFGATYAEMEDSENFNRSRIPHSYWDRLISAMTSTAKEFHENPSQKSTQNFVVFSTLLFL